MSDPNDKGGAPDATRMVDFGQELPKPGGSGLGIKGDPLPTNRAVRLYVEAGPRAPAVITLREAVTVLGRGSGVADIDVGDDSASRRHAYIIHKKGKFSLHDMGSTNGTILNGEIVGETKLSSGDRIQIGTAVLRFEVEKR